MLPPPMFQYITPAPRSTLPPVRGRREQPEEIHPVDIWVNENYRNSSVAPNEDVMCHLQVDVVHPEDDGSIFTESPRYELHATFVSAQHTGCILFSPRTLIDTYTGLPTERGSPHWMRLKESLVFFVLRESIVKFLELVRISDTSSVVEWIMKCMPAPKAHPDIDIGLVAHLEALGLHDTS
ncbi:hypothetical protein H0H93_001423 [Arthromyces matolae]|nr:hypothetical protein H0H93_001423 [Arthromyces matolae]